VLVAEDGERVIGCAFGALTRADVGHVFGVYVEPDARRQGIGSALVHTLGRLMGRRGARHVVLDLDLGNVEALAFYEELGFEETGRRLTIAVDEL
jgi:ribosomal-protein-alanine N-acetyltransferase